MVSDYHTAFAFRSMPEYVIAEGDMVAIHETYLLTHVGVFGGVPPTGKELSAAGSEMYRFASDRLVEQWVDVDVIGLLSQLGFTVTPPVHLTQDEGASAELG